MIKTDTTQHAYRQGYKAYWNGDADDKNPHAQSDDGIRKAWFLVEATNDF